MTEILILILFGTVLLGPGIWITYMVVKNGSKSEPEAPWVRNAKDLR